jgi:hypothetical protein
VILNGKCPHGDIFRIDPQPRIIVGIKQAEVRSLLIELVYRWRKLLAGHGINSNNFWQNTSVGL